MQRSRKEFEEFYAPEGRSMFRPQIAEIPIWAQRRQENIPQPRDKKNGTMFGGRVAPGKGEGGAAPGIRGASGGGKTMFVEDDAVAVEEDPGFNAKRLGPETYDLKKIPQAIDRWARDVTGADEAYYKRNPNPVAGGSIDRRPQNAPGWNPDVELPPVQQINASMFADNGAEAPAAAGPGQKASPAMRQAQPRMRETQVAGPKPKRPSMMQPAAPPEPGVPQPAAPPAAKNASDANATKSAADAYLETLRQSMEDDPAETPAEKKARLSKALFVGGMSMMAASGKHDFWESLGRGGMAGAAASDEEEQKRLGKRDKKRANTAALAKAGYDVSNDQRKAGMDERKIDIDQQRAEAEVDARGEVGRHNRAMEGIEGQRAANERERNANPRSTIRDQKAVFSEMFDETYPKGEGESDQEYKRRRASFVTKQMTERRGLSGNDRRLKLENEIRKDPMNMGKSEDEIQSMIDDRASAYESDGDIGGALPASPAAAGPKEGATATNPKTGEKMTFRNGAWTK